MSKIRMCPDRSKFLLALAPQWNTGDRHDAVGAFQPEAKRFLAYHDLDPSMLELVDNHGTKAQMRDQVLDRLAMCQVLRGVFFFCHGYKTGIQFGFDMKTVALLAAQIAKVSPPKVVVCYYSCDVARDADADRLDDLATLGGDGGFADETRDALCRVGAINCSVDGHTTPGHTTRNPYVRRFLGAGSIDGGHGGFYIVPKQKKALWNTWVKQLRTDFRFEYPLLSEAEIIDHLVTV